VSVRTESKAADFIDDIRIEETLAAARSDPARVREVLAKSLSKKRLEPDEAASLLAIREPDLWQEVFAAARKLKNDVYGNRIVLFAPLYVGDKCINDCAYCGSSARTATSCARPCPTRSFGRNWSRSRDRDTSG